MNIPNFRFDVSDTRMIVANIDEKEYHFIVREHSLVGKVISLFENGKEYGLIDKQIAVRDKFIRSELTKLEHFNIDMLYNSPGWIWVGMNQFGLYAREATPNEVEIFMRLKENVNYLDVYIDTTM
ncbi:hypothetical protein [Bacillus cereus]|uniref:Group-specific protein n=1 Tax=Bacillus cereus HuA4-10 TaxID=1053206 RepID=J8ABS2_BACCE|nr:hypothetical protein [Bacillus cereus]EJQ79093.1 hypothetical protein IGC_02622 [Bacillus cereus HuA4-10]